jgi:mono/diheme cytochrome c family protein
VTLFEQRSPTRLGLGLLPALLFAAAPGGCGRKQWPDRGATEAALPPAEHDVEEHTARPIQTDFPYQASVLGTNSPVGKIIHKSISIRLAPDVAVAFDTDLLRMGAGWTGAFIRATGVTFDTTHGTHPWAGGVPHFVTAPAPGWADARGRFTDPRKIPYGPLPESWGRWDGLHVVGNDVVLGYSVGGVKIHEQPSAVRIGERIAFVRTFRIQDPDRPLSLLVADVEGAPAGGGGGGLTLAVEGTRVVERPRPRRGNGGQVDAGARSETAHETTEVRVVGAPAGSRLENSGRGRLLLHLPQSKGPALFKVLITRAPSGSPSVLGALADAAGPPRLAAFESGGPRHWPTPIVTRGQRSDGAGPYVVDRITTPYPGVYEGSPKSWQDNIFHRRIMIAGFDFFPGGTRAALSTWEGDVWIVDGIDGDLDRLTWHRFASGLFEPLGLAIVGGVIHTSGRDQITRLHDLNGDGEADHYENFNNQSTNSQGFHEFQFDLQTDAKGNFYTAKAAPVRAGGRGFGGGGGNGEVTPFAGTVHKISPDGKRREVYATGLRAPNGIGVSPDGQVTAGDNEGTWMPACPIHWVRPGSYHGVEDSAHRKPLPRPDPPLCWISKAYDNSGGSQIWVTSDQWGPFKGELLHLSYGRASIYLVLKQAVDTFMQGGIVRLVGGPDAAQITGTPVKLTSSAMRARFNPADGQLYVAGLSGWQSDAVALTGFDRIRYTGKEVHSVRGLAATTAGVELSFSHPLDPSSVDAQAFSVQRWNYLRSQAYGSPELSIDNPGKRGHDRVEVLQARLSDDRKSVLLELADLRLANQMLIQLRVKASDGTPIRQSVMHTIHKLPRDPRAPSGPRVAARPRGEPGLLLRLQGDTSSAKASTVAPAVKLHVAPGTPASPFLPAGPFTATWQGTLWPEMRGRYLLAAEASGDLQVSLNDKVVLTGTGPAVRSVPLPLDRKANQLEVRLRGRGPVPAGLRLSWARVEEGADVKNARFEPIPESALRHERTPDLTAGLSARAGRELFLEHRCGQCHLSEVQRQQSPELAARGPDLAGIGSRLDWRWVREWVLNPRGVRASARMPALLHGPQARDDAEAIAAYLASLTDGKVAAAREDHARVVQKALDETSDGEPARKESPLIGKLLCAGCHVDQENAADDGRLPLDGANRKFLRGALTAYLLDPTVHYAWNPMPNFRLGQTEARELETALRSRGGGRRPTPPPPGDPQLVARGRSLVESTGCLSCHDAPGAGLHNRAALVALGSKASTSCLEGTGPARHGFSKEETAQLQSFIVGGIEPALRHDPAEFAERQLRQLRCTGCHGTFEGLPELELMGEKLRPEWMAAVLAGRLPYKPRAETHPDGQPWMPARMPGFAAQAQLLAAGLAARAGHPARTPADGKLDSGLAQAGATLVSASGGFSCVACHGVGNRPPTQVFEAEGINLLYSFERLRPDFFRRWLREPMKVDPSTRMPTYFDETGRSPLTGILGGDADVQIEAIWHYLHKLARDNRPASAALLRP